MPDTDRRLRPGATGSVRTMAGEDLHDIATARLRRLGQRYTAQRRGLMEALDRTDHPMTVQQLMDHVAGIAQSSAYRNLAVLEQAGVVHRIVTADDFARYELAQDLTQHHHHLICASCGDVTDFTLPSTFEADLEARLSRAARRSGFAPADHRLDVLGICANCG